MTFGISPHWPGRILPGGVEVKMRDWCGVGTEETGDIHQEEGIGLWPAESDIKTQPQINPKSSYKIP